MKVIGITGGIGAGKTTVSAMFEKLGAEVCDADEIVREAEEKDGALFSKIIEVFGEEMKKENGELDKKKLANLVFSDKGELEKLNGIVHKYVFYVMEERIKNCKSDVICLDVPLLFSSEFPIKYDFSVGVAADMEVRIRRVEVRDNAKREDIIKRINNQISDEELFEKADFIIENNSAEETFEAVKNIMEAVRNS